MAWSWGSPNVSRVTIKDAVVPSETRNFEGINARNSYYNDTQGQTVELKPDVITANINKLANIVGFQYQVNGIYRTVKNEGVES